MSSILRQTLPRGVRSVRRPVAWRSLALGLTFLAAVVGMSVGVGVSERDILGAGLAERAYYALGLFVLGGLDIGTPMGGPLYGRVLLWGAYFAAPLITASALIETAIRLIGPWALRARRLEDHVVLGGAGRLTQLYVRRLRERDLRRTVVVVEQDPDKPSLVALRDVYRAVIIHGDITKDEVLERARVDRARQVLFLTNDDFANLDAASKVLKTAPGLAGRIVVHVSDLGFMRQTASSSVAEACEFFNGHEFAAVNLVQEQLVDRFNSTPQLDLVVLAGFGRFGQTVLHQLNQHAAGSFSHVIIIDERASRQVRAFEAQTGVSGDYVCSVIDGDLLDPEAWRRVGEVVEAHGHDPVVILGCGSDGTNLHAALLARRQHPSAYVIVRSFRASPFTAEIAEESGVHAFNLAGLIEKGMPEAWF